jgi:hypothetical protein
MHAELYLDPEARLFVGGRHAAVGLRRQGRYQTLCEAAVEACQSTRRASLPEGAKLVGHVDAMAGWVRLLPTFVTAVGAAWGSPIDLHQLESVARAKEADESGRFRRAVVTGNVSEMARLGPRRHWRF